MLQKLVKNVIFHKFLILLSLNESLYLHLLNQLEKMKRTLENSDLSLILMLTILFISLMLVIFGLIRFLEKRRYRSCFAYYNGHAYCKKYGRRKIS